MDRLYGGKIICRARLAGSAEIPGFAAARAKTAPGEKLRLVLDTRNPARPVLVELLGSFTCGNPYEEDVSLGWIEGSAGESVARMLKNGARLFGAVTDMDGDGMEIAVVMRETGLI